VEVEWDDAKSRRNARERGLPFDLAFALFAGSTLEWPDERADYGEDRQIAIGRVGDRHLVCVYTWRGTEEHPVRRIISLRKATRGERHAYQEAKD
jgi:uncharacterized DUF497 family protein